MMILIRNKTERTFRLKMTMKIHKMRCPRCICVYKILHLFKYERYSISIIRVERDNNVEAVMGLCLYLELATHGVINGQRNEFGERVGVTSS